MHAERTVYTSFAKRSFTRAKHVCVKTIRKRRVFHAATNIGKKKIKNVFPKPKWTCSSTASSRNETQTVSSRTTYNYRCYRSSTLTLALNAKYYSMNNCVIPVEPTRKKNTTNIFAAKNWQKIAFFFFFLILPTTRMRVPGSNDYCCIIRHTCFALTDVLFLRTRLIVIVYRLLPGNRFCRFGWCKRLRVRFPRFRIVLTRNSSRRGTHRPQ